MAISNSKPSKPLNYQRVTLHKITPPIGPGSWMFEMCHMSTRAIQKVRPGRSLRDVHSAWGLKTIVADLIHGLWRMRSRKDPGSVSSSRESLGFTVVRTSRVRRSFDFWKCLGIWYLDISGLLYKNSPTSNHQKIIRFFFDSFFWWPHSEVVTKITQNNSILHKLQAWKTQFIFRFFAMRCEKFHSRQFQESKSSDAASNECLSLSIAKG